MNKTLNRIFEVYVFACSFFLASKHLTDPDFWFHLKTGEYILTTGMIPRTEAFSFTHYGAPWIAHGWLSGVTFYAIYSKLGLNALKFIFAILIALAFWIVYKRCNSHPFVSSLATLLGVWTLLPNIGVRPRVFTILLSSVSLALLARYARRGTGKEIWWLVPIMVLWVNLHGGFFIQLLLIGLTITGILIDAWANGEKIGPLWPRLRTLSLVLLACAVAVLLNPYGARLYISPIRVLQSPVFMDLVVDFISPDFHQPELRPLMMLILLSIGAVALSPKRPRPSEMLFYLATLYSTLNSQRNTAIFTLVAVPILAEYSQNWLNSTSFGKSFAERRSSSTSRASVLLTVLLLLPLVVLAVKLRSVVYGAPDQETLKVPVKAVEYLREHRLTGNTFTFPNVWGAYVLWELPSNPVYIDGRDVYSEEFVRHFADMTRGLADWREPFDRYGVQIAIIRTRSVMARQLQESPAWEHVYSDDMSVVFKRR